MTATHTLLRRPFGLRRGASAALWLFVGIVSASLTGCEVHSYCVMCGDDGGVADLGDGSVGPRDWGVLDAPFDAGRPDGCVDVELCNGYDDDCDGLTDEGFDTNTDLENCGACGRFCSPIHAFGACEAGECLIDACNVGFIDLDHDPATGCEYRCLSVALDDSLCDLRDDDCDGQVDEDVALSTDTSNCGRCGRVCRSPRAVGSCLEGVCTLGTCETGYYDLDGSEANGCEYRCTLGTPPFETCNLRDDDCDGVADEGNPGAGLRCGSDVGGCVPGVTRCDAGTVVCDGEIVPTAELCNGVDDDCDGVTDEGDPEGGRVCGTATGACEVGREVCTGGALVCTDAIGPTLEVCNSLDDDCDGLTDEGNPDGGGACGSSIGACETGSLVCTRGTLACVGGVVPVAEVCNGVDDDCDGAVDDGTAEAGLLCGTDVGRCARGVQQCVSGSVVCVGQTVASAETCDGTDEDCDGTPDDGNPGGGGSCGTATGACELGTTVCITGNLVCQGGVSAVVETCNGVDDDCNGLVDETFSLNTDTRNCGTCGHVCSLANTAQRCAAGACAVGGCQSGFVDLDGLPANGCEYACSLAGREVCNGRDDDCDGTVDEDTTPPPLFCNPNGVCAGTGATCGGAAGWVCLYPTTFQGTETRCDGLDNDCDGLVDEAFPLVGAACGNGSGACCRVGTFLCNVAGDGVMCNAPAAGAPGDESCNGLDDDCDGLIDEPGVNDPATAWRDAIDQTAIPNVTFLSGGRSVRVMQFEASRPDASATSAGLISTLACSRANVQPWTNVTFPQAQAACCALSVGGTCPGSTGGQLCRAGDWQAACEGPAGTCAHSYATSCGGSQRTTCNGMEYDSDPALAGDQDALFTTASPTFASCYTDWAAAGRVYDLSGNAKEWTSTAVGTNLYEVLGGSYQSIEAGRACDFDFTVAEQSFSAPTTGFRCCQY